MQAARLPVQIGTVPANPKTWGIRRNATKVANATKGRQRCSAGRLRISYVPFRHLLFGRRADYR
jgi:hypothetical protein